MFISSSSLKIFLISMSPLVELRGAIPLGVFRYQLSLTEALCLSLAGNILAALCLTFFLNFFFEKIIRFLPFLTKFSEWILNKTRQRHQAKFVKWQEFALLIIVGIPLPFTGAWTGTLAAYVFGIPPKRAAYFISLGVVLAGIIVSFLTLNGIYLFQ